MRKLNDSQKEDVKKLLNHPWFKILEWLLEDFKSDTMNKYLLWEVSLADEANLKAFEADKDYLKWAAHFLAKVKSNTSWVWKKKED